MIKIILWISISLFSYLFKRKFSSRKIKFLFLKFRFSSLEFIHSNNLIVWIIFDFWNDQNEILFIPFLFVHFCSLNFLRSFSSLRSLRSLLSLLSLRSLRSLRSLSSVLLVQFVVRLLVVVYEINFIIIQFDFA